MNKHQLEILEELQQFPRTSSKEHHNELIIGKNDPKNGERDYWWCSYGDINLSMYYSLPKLLVDLADECIKRNYARVEENVLLN